MSESKENHGQQMHEYPPGNPPPYAGYPHLPPQDVYGPPPPQVVHATVLPSMVPAIVVSQPMGPNPVAITCRSCHHEIVTRVDQKSTTKTHLFALLLCVIGCWPCACIPYCMDSCRSADHYCPNCNAYIGSYSS